MLLSRRNYLRFACAAATTSPISRIARAEGYPTRPVRLIVGFPPGGGTDVAARLISQWLSGRLGQTIIVENRPGAGSTIATEVAARADADGYTLLLVSTAHAINATLYDRLNYDLMRDIAPVAGFIRVPNILVVNPSLPVRSLSEFIEFAKAHPGSINMASGGNGTSQHLSGEMFKLMTGLDIVHVPYRGAAPALSDLVGGQVQVMFGDMAPALEFIRAGKLRALAITAATRSKVMPDLPTVSEFVPGYESSAWYGVGAPKNTPGQIVEKLNKEINAGIVEPKMMERLVALGGAPLEGTPSDFGELIASETKKWARVVKFSGAKPE
jgi:tripartite-type tricarboxylate transporter receptor subunit TctC